MSATSGACSNFLKNLSFGTHPSMKEFTEAEKKIAKIFEEVLANNPEVEPHVIPMIKEISMTPFLSQKNTPGAMVIFMPLQLLIHARLHYTKLVAPIKRAFSNSVIIFARNNEIRPVRNHNPDRKREELIQDLVFPSTIVGRITEMESSVDMTHEVLLEPKSQQWAKPELSTIENIMSEMFKGNFKIRTFASAK